jgi:hypothetical protein
VVRAYLEAHRDEIDVADFDLVAFVLVTVVEALTHAAVLRRPGHPQRRESGAVCGRCNAPGGPVSANVVI